MRVSRRPCLRVARTANDPSHSEDLRYTDRRRIHIARQTTRVDRLAAAVADAPDIGPLVSQLREANARLGQLRERRSKLASARAVAPTKPSPERIRGYFDDLVSTLESDPAAARDVLAASFSTVRLVPTASAYRLELTMAEVCGKPNCGCRI
jgi:hypothetical protein